MLAQTLQITGPPVTFFVRPDGTHRRSARRRASPRRTRSAPSPGSTSASHRDGDETRPASAVPDWLAPLAAALADDRPDRTGGGAAARRRGPGGRGAGADRRGPGRVRRSCSSSGRRRCGPTPARSRSRAGPPTRATSTWPTPPCARRRRRPGSTAAGVEVLGLLPPAHVAVSGFDVTAVVAWWREPSPVAAVDPREVAVGADRARSPSSSIRPTGRRCGTRRATPARRSRLVGT